VGDALHCGTILRMFAMSEEEATILFFLIGCVCLVLALFLVA
jgi:hypothetical protein